MTHTQIITAPRDDYRLIGGGSVSHRQDPGEAYNHFARVPKGLIPDDEAFDNVSDGI